jgi:hypothetical protein
MPDIIDRIDHAVAGLQCPCVCPICLNGDHCDSPSCTSDDDCTCAMTEASMWSCPVHGENANSDDDGNYLGTVGEFEIAYLQGDYDRCTRCGRHWHGLPVTERIARMYARGQYDHDYSYTDDDTEILCPGSEIGVPPTVPEGRNHQSYRSTTRRMIEFGVVMDECAEVFARFAQEWRRREIRWLEAIQSWPDPTLNLDFSAWFGHNHVTVPGVENHPWWREHCTPPVTVDLGPKLWHYELLRIPTERQFPRPYFRFLSPIEVAVRNHWRELTAPAYPLPDRPGYDFTALTAQLERSDHGPNRRQPATPRHRGAGQPAPATMRRRQRGRRRA